MIPKVSPKVSIIFPIFNGWLDTKECLESIEQLNYPKEKLEVIVVDNGSTDGSQKVIKSIKSKSESKGIKFTLIENKANLGFAKAVNNGVRKAKGEYLLITNNDVVFDKNYLKNLVEFLEKNPNVGIVGGKVYYKNPKDKIAFGGAKFDFFTGVLKPNLKPDETFETDWVSGCDMLIRKEVIEKIGDFDKKFFFYFEDLDLCLRAKKSGYKVIYYPKAILWHGEGQSIDKEDWRKKSEFYYQGKTRILFKHASKIQLISSLVFEFSFGLLWQILVLKHQNYTPAIKALVKQWKEK